MEESGIRKPAVAGQFYPAQINRLKKQIEDFALKGFAPKEVIGCVLPHAGYIYSGRVATETVSRIQIKERIIILGPNHTGMGKPFGIMTQGIWQIPFGEISVDKELAEILLKECNDLQEDNLSHQYEHSIEVELPILYYFRDNFKFVPITVLGDEPSTYRRIGEGIARAVRKSDLISSVLVIASSDMTHYESQFSAEKKDRLAIEAILELDADKLLERITRYGISMCGWGPVAIMLYYARYLDASQAELIRYQTSGDVTGDYSAVVGYAGIIVY